MISRFLPTWISRARARSLQRPGRVLGCRRYRADWSAAALANDGHLLEHHRDALLIHQLKQSQNQGADVQGVLPPPSGCSAHHSRLAMRPRSGLAWASSSP